MPRRHVLAVFTTALEGRQEEYAAWYDTEHVADMLSVPGVVSARRLEAASTVGPFLRSSPYGNLTLYEVETDDLDGVLDHLAREAPAWSRSAAMDTSGHALWAFTDPRS